MARKDLGIVHLRRIIIFVAGHMIVGHEEIIEACIRFGFTVCISPTKECGGIVCTQYVLRQAAMVHMPASNALTHNEPNINEQPMSNSLKQREPGAQEMDYHHCHLPDTPRQRRRDPKTQTVPKVSVG